MTKLAVSDHLRTVFKKMGHLISSLKD